MSWYTLLGSSTDRNIQSATDASDVTMRLMGEVFSMSLARGAALAYAWSARYFDSMLVNTGVSVTLRCFWHPWFGVCVDSTRFSGVFLVKGVRTPDAPALATACTSLS